MAIESTNAKDGQYSLDAMQFIKTCRQLYQNIDWSKYDYIYPIPKNGLYIGHYLSVWAKKELIMTPEGLLAVPRSRTLVVDDLIDSGRTLRQFMGYDKAVLFIKHKKQTHDLGIIHSVNECNSWIHFPWEKENDIEDAITRQIEYIGEDVNREGLVETPKRIRKSWEKLYGGYKENPEDILAKRFTPEANYPTPIILKDVEFYSTCEHHLLPFFGHISVAYIPNKEIVGISKLARLVECFARRMQIQERLTEQIAESIHRILQPLGVWVLCEAQHFCMVSRGVQKKEGVMITTAFRGCLEDKTDMIMELLNH